MNSIITYPLIRTITIGIVIFFNIQFPLKISHNLSIRRIRGVENFIIVPLNRSWRSPDGLFQTEYDDESKTLSCYIGEDWVYWMGKSYEKWLDFRVNEESTSLKYEYPEFKKPSVGIGVSVVRHSGYQKLEGNRLKAIIYDKDKKILYFIVDDEFYNLLSLKEFTFRNGREHAIKFET
jgi:hypothetical protein